MEGLPINLWRKYYCHVSSCRDDEWTAASYRVATAESGLCRWNKSARLQPVYVRESVVRTVPIQKQSGMYSTVTVYTPDTGPSGVVRDAKGTIIGTKCLLRYTM